MNARHVMLCILPLLIISFSRTEGQDFRGVKWGMSKREIMDDEKEAQLEKNESNKLWYRLESRNGNFTDLQFVYDFNEGGDSLHSITCIYNGATQSLYELLIQLNQERSEKSIVHYNDIYWRSNDGSAITHLQMNQDRISEFTAPINHPDFRALNFSRNIRPPEPRISGWKTVTTFYGVGSETTDDFTISASKWKATWRAQSENSDGGLFFGAMVYKGEAMLEIMGNVYRDGNGESVYRSKGVHYIKVTSGSAKWTIEIQEYIDK